MRPLLAAAALVAAACARPEPPDAAYRALVEAVRARDADAAWERLSSGTRAWLDQRAKVAGASAPGVVPSSGKELLLGSAALASRAPRSIVVLRESADRAVLQVEGEGGAPREVTLVKEGRWRVEIPAPAGGAANQR